MAQTPLIAARAIPWVPLTGSSVGYDPTTSGLTSTDTQAAIDEIQAEIAGLGGTYLTRTLGEQAAIQTFTASGSAVTIDCSLGNTFDITLTANCTLTITNPASSGVDSHIVVILRQGGSGSYTVTWPASVKWQSATGTNTGSAPTLWTAVGAQDVVELSTVDGGTTWGGYLMPHPVSAYTLTVDDEGTPLSTGATTLDFVGAGVTASGSGTTKSITIPGGATASDTGIWRPLLDAGTGAIIVDGTTGEAVMGFGPA